MVVMTEKEERQDGGEGNTGMVRTKRNKGGGAGVGMRLLAAAILA